MDVTLSKAAAAYAEALGRKGAAGAGAGGAEADAAAGGVSFADMLQQAAVDVVDTVRAGESTAQLAVLGKAELVDVVSAVSNAEVALETVVAIRDQVMQAYQDIMRMPI